MSSSGSGRVASCDPDAGDEVLAQAASAAESVPHFVVSGVTLESPILHPPQIFAVGLNYADHVAESGMETPKFPMIFNTQYTSARGPFASSHRPAYSTALDYEGELVVVIGKSCHRVPRDRAHEVVAGWTVCNDVWVRD